MPDPANFPSPAETARMKNYYRGVNAGNFLMTAFYAVAGGAAIHAGHPVAGGTIMSLNLIGQIRGSTDSAGAQNESPRLRDGTPDAWTNRGALTAGFLRATLKSDPVRRALLDILFAVYFIANFKKLQAQALAEKQEAARQQQAPENAAPGTAAETPAPVPAASVEKPQQPQL